MGLFLVSLAYITLVITSWFPFVLSARHLIKFNGPSFLCISFTSGVNRVLVYRVHYGNKTNLLIKLYRCLKTHVQQIKTVPSL